MVMMSNEENPTALPYARRRNAWQAKWLWAEFGNILGSVNWTAAWLSTSDYLLDARNATTSAEPRAIGAHNPVPSEGRNAYAYFARIFIQNPAFVCASQWISSSAYGMKRLFSVRHRPSWSVDISSDDRLLGPSFDIGNSFSLRSQPQYQWWA